MPTSKELLELLSKDDDFLAVDTPVEQTPAPVPTPVPVPTPEPTPAAEPVPAPAVDPAPEPFRAPGSDKVDLSAWYPVIAAVAILLVAVGVFLYNRDNGDGSLPRKYNKAANRIRDATKELFLDMASHHKETAGLLRQNDESVSTIDKWIARDQEFNNEAFSRFLNNTGEVEMDFLPTDEGAATGGEEHALYSEAVAAGFLRAINE